MVVVTAVNYVGYPKIVPHRCIYNKQTPMKNI